MARRWNAFDGEGVLAAGLFCWWIERQTGGDDVRFVMGGRTHGLNERGLKTIRQTLEAWIEEVAEEVAVEFWQEELVELLEAWAEQGLQFEGRQIRDLQDWIAQCQQAAWEAEEGEPGVAVESSLERDGGSTGQVMMGEGAPDEVDGAKEVIVEQRRGETWERWKEFDAEAGNWIEYERDLASGMFRISVVPEVGEPILGSSNYRDRFFAATPALEGVSDWEIHHTLQQEQVIAERFLREKNINVHDLQHLRAVPQKVHSRINILQRKWWDSWVGKKVNGVTIRSTEHAREIVPLEEVEKFAREIELEFVDLWVEQGDSRSIRKKVAQLKRLSPDALHAKAVSRELKLLRAAAGIVALAAIFEQATLAVQIARADEVPELNRLLSSFDVAMEQQRRTGRVSQNQLEHIYDALDAYLAAIGMDADRRNQALYIYRTRIIGSSY